MRGDAAVVDADPRVTAATEEDWRTEYLDAIIAVRVVDSLEAAIDHIETYGSHHTDCIVTEDKAAAETLPQRGRLGDRPAQRLDPVRRRRRIRLRGGDRHRHRPHACARARRGRAALHVQVSGAGRRPDAAIAFRGAPALSPFWRSGSNISSDLRTVLASSRKIWRQGPDRSAGARSAAAQKISTAPCALETLKIYLTIRHNLICLRLEPKESHNVPSSF